MPLLEIVVGNAVCGICGALAGKCFDLYQEEIKNAVDGTLKVVSQATYQAVDGTIKASHQAAYQANGTMKAAGQAAYKTVDGTVKAAGKVYEEGWQRDYNMGGISSLVKQPGTATA